MLLVPYLENHWSKWQASSMTNDEKLWPNSKMQKISSSIMHFLPHLHKHLPFIFSPQGRLCYLMIYFHLWDQLNWIFIIRYLLRPKINSYKFCKNRCWHPDFPARVVLQTCSLLDLYHWLLVKPKAPEANLASELSWALFSAVTPCSPHLTPTLPKLLLLQISDFVLNY